MNFLSINKGTFLIILSTKIKMYQRKRKDDFSKKIEQMIVGRSKRPCNNIDVNDILSNSTDINSTDINSTDINSIINNSTNINDKNNEISDNSNDNNDRGINGINSSTNNCRVTRWVPFNKKIEGIRKFGDKRDNQLY
jgi:hypothetical protein